jgi:hypothetical protein
LVAVAAFFLGAVVAFLTAVAAVFGLAVDFFLKSCDNLYELLVWTRSPAATAALRLAREVAFCHFLSFGSEAIIALLMAIMEEPERSLSSAIAWVIPALYDMVEYECKVQTVRLQEKEGASKPKVSVRSCG